jgi:hypothetical protein
MSPYFGPKTIDLHEKANFLGIGAMRILIHIASPMYIASLSRGKVLKTGRTHLLPVFEYFTS